jgi:hypothetical protein
MKKTRQFSTILLRAFLLCILGLSFLMLTIVPDLPKNGVLNPLKSCEDNYPTKDDAGPAFYDMIDGGTCWSCPNGFVRPPTIFPVNSDKACLGFKKATKVGEYGCKNKYGKNAFFDMIQGGTCWTCPSGYIRTAEAVTHAKACAKDLIFGPWSKATKKGKDECDEGFGDPIDGGTCWKCPKGGTRTVFAVNSDKACEVNSKAIKRGPDSQMLELSKAAKDNVKKLAQDFSDQNPEVMKVLYAIHEKVNGPLKQIFTGNQFSTNVKNGNYDAIWNQAKPDLEPLINQISSIISTQGENIQKFTVLSISVGGTASVGLGLSVDEGILIDFAKGVKLSGYYSYSIVGAPSVGVGTAVTIGLWKNDIDCGAGFNVNVGFSVPTPVGLEVGISGSIGIDLNAACNKDWAAYINLNALQGFSLSLTVGIGVGVDVGASFGAQMIYQVVNGKLQSKCSPCGGKGQRPCSLVERFPSCDFALYEKCGTCQQ